MIMNDVICTENLTKYFGKVHAVDSVSLNIKKGEIYGFLGLNGAGKTTTIRMLLGIIRPTSGTAWLNGKKVYAGNFELWNNVGYLVEIPYAYPDLTVYENLEIIRRLRFLHDTAFVESVMDKLKLDQYRERKAKDLSHGNAQRLGIAKAMIHNPEILILDEPASGLDPAGIVEIREMLNKLAHEKGVTIFISSHILGEISKFANRIGIIHEGKLVQESETAHMERSRYRKLHVDARDNEGAESILIKNGYTVATAEGGFLEVSGKDAINFPEKVASLLVHEGSPPVMLKVEEEDLESYFLRIIGKEGGIK
jgi:ABC-2 type transport system ATP-binding protein